MTYDMPDPEPTSPRLWDASPGVCCAAFQLGACAHTEAFWADAICGACGLLLDPDVAHDCDVDDDPGGRGYGEPDVCAHGYEISGRFGDLCDVCNPPNAFCLNRSTAGDACGSCSGCVREVARLREVEPF